MCSLTPAEAASHRPEDYSRDGRAWANLGTSSYCLSCNTGDSSDCRERAASVPVPVSEKGEKAVEDT